MIARWPDVKDWEIEIRKSQMIAQQECEVAYETVSSGWVGGRRKLLRTRNTVNIGGMGSARFGIAIRGESTTESAWSPPPEKLPRPEFFQATPQEITQFANPSFRLNPNNTEQI